MNTTTRALLAAAAIGVSLLNSIAHAAEGGLIGKRYAGLDFNYERYNSSAIDFTYGTGAVLNLPINASLDTTFGYNLAHTNDPDHSLNHNALQGSLLTHRRTEYGTAYFAGTLGQKWDRVKNFGILARDDDAYWALSAGYEVPVGAVTAYNLGLAYRTPFRGDQKTLQYRLEANHWFYTDFGGVASVTYNHIHHGPNTLLYMIGLRWSL